MIAADKLEYTTVADRLLGRPAKNDRNRYILNAREGRVGEKYITIFCDTYDAVYAITPGLAYQEALGAVREIRRAEFDEFARTKLKQQFADDIAMQLDKVMYESLKANSGR